MLPPDIAAKRAEPVRVKLAVICNRPADPKQVVTCEGCGANDNCEFVWDLYNTDGDCLAEK